MDDDYSALGHVLFLLWTGSPITRLTHECVP